MDSGPQPLEPGDADLIARFCAGDETAFDLLVLRHRRTVYRVAWRLTGRHEAADDLSQETFLRAYRGLRSFRGESSLATWLARIVLNLARGGRVVRERAVLPLEEAGGIEVAGGAAESVLSHQVRTAAGRLPPRQRQVVVLKVYEGWTFADIAREMRISVGTAKATFSQAVRSLRARLGVQRSPAGACRSGETEVTV